MYFITRDKVREAFRALRAEGYHDPKFEAVLEQLGGGSKTTLGKYYGPIKAEFEAMDISGSEPELNHRGGSMPLAQDTGAPATAPAPVETTPMPTLYEARARYHAARAPYGRVAQHSEPLKTKIDALQARQAQLTEERASRKIHTVERLRAVKALQVELEEELEVLHNQYDPLGKAAETSGREASRLRAACEAVRQNALKALENTRRLHFAVKDNAYGPNPALLQRQLAVLTELIGEEDVEKYVTALTWPNETSRHVPPWNSPFWVDTSSTTQG